MSTQEKEAPSLDLDSEAKLTDFARACKAAARAVTLYPSSHPAIRLSLGRLVDAASRMTEKGPVTLGVVPDNLLMDGAAPPRPDQAGRKTASLMHDIGKVKTPNEILNKPDKLTDEEFAIMKRHVADGDEILRGTPENPSLAPIVAFEHHLRLDGTGYPHGVTRPTLNLATMLCGVADVYDAMRSQRKCQQAYPSERILAVLQCNDGKQFDQHLVRRFVQLLGIYSVGNLVKPTTASIRCHSSDC
jgi:hypothetical protein